MWKNHVELEDKRLAAKYINLCDIQAISICGVDYLKELKRDFQSWTMTPQQIKKIKNPRFFDSNVKEQADQAANILQGVFNQKAKLMGLR